MGTFSTAPQTLFIRNTVDKQISSAVCFGLIMPRIARVVVPGVAHHVTQRGNRRQEVFFTEDDRQRYLSWLRHYAQSYRLKIWAYCLMTNHMHLVAVPEVESSLAETLHRLHTRHSQRINAAHGWQGHLGKGDRAFLDQ